MAIFERLATLLRSNVNHIINEAEDHKKTNELVINANAQTINELLRNLKSCCCLEFKLANSCWSASLRNK